MTEHLLGVLFRVRQGIIDQVSGHEHVQFDDMFTAYTWLRAFRWKILTRVLGSTWPMPNVLLATRVCRVQGWKPLNFCEGAL